VSLINTSLDGSADSGVRRRLLHSIILGLLLLRGKKRMSSLLDELNVKLASIAARSLVKYAALPDLAIRKRHPA
jgi:hypothetical protein